MQRLKRIPTYNGITSTVYAIEFLKRGRIKYIAKENCITTLKQYEEAICENALGIKMQTILCQTVYPLLPRDGVNKRIPGEIIGPFDRYIYLSTNVRYRHGTTELKKWCKERAFSTHNSHRPSSKFPRCSLPFVRVEFKSTFRNQINLCC